LKVKYLSVQGSNRLKETAVIDLTNVYGVLSAASEVHFPSAGPKIINGRSGSQLANTSIIQDLSAASLSYGYIDPKQTLAKANDNLRILFSGEEFDITKVSAIPFVRFALVFIGKDARAQIITAGDCQSLIEMKNGSFAWTDNFCREYDLKNYDLIKVGMATETDAYLKKYGFSRGDLIQEDLEEIRESMWRNDFAKTLEERRKEFINRKFAALNGDPAFWGLCQTRSIDITDIKTIICYTGGFVDIGATGRMDLLAPKIIDSCRKHGLISEASRTQEAFSRKALQTHIDKREISVIAIEP
jgi:hypothetical protein